jgi:hypothetical protein
MIALLRQMSLEELRYAAAACGAEPTPEGIVRALCRECAILGWGFVPLNREDALFEQVAQRLGVAAGARGAAGLCLLERRVFAGLMRRAWEGADPSYQRQVLEAALGLWDAGTQNPPPLPAQNDPLCMRATLDAMLVHPGGLRALAAATEAVPLVFPLPEMPFAHAGGPLGAISMSQLAALRPRPERGYPALLQVLAICWRARRRLLLERRTQQQQLKRQLRQLQRAMEQRARDLKGITGSWAKQWLRGLAVAGGSAAAGSLQLVLGGDPVVGWVAAAAGLAWGAAAWATQPRVEADPRYARLQREASVARQQLATLQHAIAALELE